MLLRDIQHVSPEILGWILSVGGIAVLTEVGFALYLERKHGITKKPPRTSSVRRNKKLRGLVN